jgi:hypothetical protein
LGNLGGLDKDQDKLDGDGVASPPVGGVHVGMDDGDGADAD